MNLEELLDVISHDATLSTDSELATACRLIVYVQSMNSGQRDTLKAAHNKGPLWDGDVPSKASRDALLEAGLIEKVVVKGEQGFNACTYKGADAYLIITAIQHSETPQIAAVQV